MKKSLMAIFSLMVLLGVSLVVYGETVIFSLDDDIFYVVPTGCPLEPNNCSANPICEKAKVKDEGDARVIISSDMAGTNGISGSDPDDIQSFVHMLTFSDRIDIEGILSGVNRPSNNSNASARFLDIISAFGSDRQNLVNNFGSDFPTVSYLNSLVKSGSLNSHPINSTNSEANNAAVEQIISRARCGWHNGDKRPLYLLSWGGSTDIAQAIFNAPDIIPVVRLVAYSLYNNGDFPNPTTCVSSGNRTCDAWNFLRTKTDLWWVDYTNFRLPLPFCEDSVNSVLKAGGALGSKIIDSLEPPANERCADLNSPYLDSTTQDWLKLGDTWTLMYTHNSASLRDDPTSNSGSKYGQYFQPDPSRPYWRLVEEPNSSPSFKNISTLYQDWLNRASLL